MTDYYAVLGLAHAAEADEIAKAYRRAALTYNPECNRENPHPDNARRFKLVSQAYVVLSNPKLRAIYDMYGDDGVKHGGTGTVGVPGGLDVSSVNPDQVFRQFFGVDSPFQVLGDISGLDSTQHHFFAETAAKNKSPPKAPVVECVANITLRDVYDGNTRTVSWTNHHINARGEKSNPTEKSFLLAVPKGIATGDKVTLSGLGNTHDAGIQGDVIVTINVEVDSYFKRSGNDVIVTVPISLADALSGVTIAIRTMKDRELSLLIDEIVHQNFERVIKDEGLPVYGSKTEERGNLVVKCATEFPKYLTAEQKSEIRRILESA